MAGKIISQSRPNGSTVRNNDSVTITIGRFVATNNNNNSNNTNSNNNNSNNSTTNNSGTDTESDIED